MEAGGEFLDEVVGQLQAVLRGLRGGEHFLEAVEGGEAPVGDLGEEGVLFFVEDGGRGEAADVLFDDLELAREGGVEGRVEVSVEDLVDDPSRDAGSAYCRHLFCASGMSVFVHIWLEPWWDGSPLFSNVKRQIVDRTIETVEASCILVVVQRCTRLSKALVCKCVLKLLDLCVLVEIVLLDLAVLGLCSSLVSVLLP